MFSGRSSKEASSTGRFQGKIQRPDRDGSYDLNETDIWLSTQQPSIAVPAFNALDNDIV